tara:strand:+ start:76 stop:858 length:783 start_codon:yes stop_codon:yes gene_type:complete
MSKLDTKDPMGARMKGYERVETDRKLNGIIYARIDGRGFSKFTKSFKKPYDTNIIGAMQATTEYLVRVTNAVCGYTQSDEISLMWDNTDDPKSEHFFAGKVQKMVSTLAAMASVKFYSVLVEKGVLPKDSLPTFDARVYELPNRYEAMNAFLWRQQDAKRNAIQMLAQSQWSHRELQNKSTKDVELMLMELDPWLVWSAPHDFMRGTFYKRCTIKREMDVGIVERSIVTHFYADLMELVNTDARVDFVCTKKMQLEQDYD